jgi:hypothetical protein
MSGAHRRRTSGCGSPPTRGADGGPGGRRQGPCQSGKECLSAPGRLGEVLARQGPEAPGVQLLEFVASHGVHTAPAKGKSFVAKPAAEVNRLSFLWHRPWAVP